MLIEQTLTKMGQLKLFGMIEALEEQLKSTQDLELSFEERFGIIIDHHYQWKENRSLQNRIKKARLKIDASIEDVDYRAHRKLTKSSIDQLSLSNWLLHHQNVIITGPTGVGKTYLACAIGQKACRNGFSVLYFYLPKLFRELELNTAQGKISNFLQKLLKTDLLIIDDWGIEQLAESQYRDFLEILDDRHENASILMTSQYPIKHWHDQMGNPTIADAILDRIVHNSHKIEMKGDSMRKVKNKKMNAKKTKKS